MFRSIDFPKSHDIEAIVRLLPAGVLADWPLREQRQLTMYAVITRYPGGYPEISLADAREALRIARQV